MPTEVNREDVRRLTAAGAQLVEVLPAEEYDAAHLAGAVNVPLKALNRRTTATLEQGRPVVVYCHDYQ
ncbi:MAG: rhodanese-like domain-containing protein [Dehalococcoidia bacterium]